MTAISSEKPRPAIFLLPGLRGSVGEEHEFLARARDRVHFHIISHLDLNAHGSLLRAINTQGEIAAAEIDRCQPDGKLHLWGVSFGGCVAYEAAASLERRGRSVVAVLVDPPFGGSCSTAWPAAGRARAICREALGLIARFDVTRTIVLRLRNRAMSYFLIGFLRRRAILNWLPTPLRNSQITVIMSKEFERTTCRHLAKLSPDARLVIGSDLHGGMFSRSWWVKVMPAFQQELAECFWNG